MWMIGRYQRHDVCAMAHIGNASGRCGIDRRPMTVYGVGVGVSQGTHGEAASTKLNTVTHSYYDGILQAYTPAIDHGQDSDRGGRFGLGLKARVRKVKKTRISHHLEKTSPNWKLEGPRRGVGNFLPPSQSQTHLPTAHSTSLGPHAGTGRKVGFDTRSDDRGSHGTHQCITRIGRDPSFHLFMHPPQPPSSSDPRA